MVEPDEPLAHAATHTIRTAAESLGVDALLLAKRLHEGEIGRLVQLLNAALPQVSTPALRHRIEDLLSSVTDGRMPMFAKPETELDWALDTLRRRREKASDAEADAGGDDASDD